LRSHLPLTHLFFFFKVTAPTEIYTLSLHDALPIYAYLPGSGNDIIVDTDAGNQILVGTERLTGSALEAKIGENRHHLWSSEDGKVIYDFDPYRKTLEVKGEALGGDGNGILLTRIENLQELQKRFGIDLGLTAKVGLSTQSGNVFTDSGSTPGDGSASMSELASRFLNISFNQAIKPGDFLRLAIHGILGVARNLIKVVTGDQILGFDGGDLVIPVSEGQSLVSVAILEQADVSSDASVTFKATLETKDQNGDALMVESNQFTFNIRDVSGTVPGDISIDNTIEGDFGPADFFDDNGNEVIKYDNLGNLITDPKQLGSWDDTL